ncbi:MAG: hypothetical protein ACP5K2_01155 [bacterium]
MSKVYVLLWFDVEDFITPQSDDALKGIIDVLDSYKIKGTFKLVGEKVRALKERGRYDIIDRLKKHDIGYHTNLHSVHPTVAEYLKDLGWEEGIKEFELRERIGYEEIIDTFDVIPSCYGQPGSSWAPHVYPVLKNWGIQVYLDEAEHIGLNEKPFWYCGILNILRLRENTTRLDLKLGYEGIKVGIENFENIFRRLINEDGGVISIWYHPCEFATYEFWDSVNFSRGKNTDRSSWTIPKLKSYERMKKELGYFSEYLNYIASHSDVQILTAREAYSIYFNKAKEELFSTSEIIHLAKEINSKITYYGFDRITLSPAEIFYLALSLLVNLIDNNLCIVESKFKLPDTIYGPIKRIDSEVIFFNKEDLAFACRWILEFINKNGRIPEAITIQDKIVSPIDFFATANVLISQLPINTSLPENIKIIKGNLLLESQVKEEGVWDWIILPEDFSAPNIIELAKLQTWTLKPAHIIL